MRVVVLHKIFQSFTISAWLSFQRKFTASAISASPHSGKAARRCTRQSGLRKMTDKLYFMTNGKLGKCKRIRNNPQAKIAPCTIRGKITGPEFAATVRILPNEEGARVRPLIKAKYWLARVPLLWRNTDTYLEITPASA